MMVLSSGCLCCNLRGDLVTALEKLLRNLDNGRASFKRVVVETTGLADPAPMLQTAMSHPYLVMRFRLDGVVTLVDAVNGSATLDHHPRSGEAGRRRRPAGADQDRSRRYAGTQRRARRADRAAAQAQSGGADSRCGRGRSHGSARCSAAGSTTPHVKSPMSAAWLADEAIAAAHDARPSSPSRRQPA